MQQGILFLLFCKMQIFKQISSLDSSEKGLTVQSRNYGVDLSLLLPTQGTMACTLGSAFTSHDTIPYYQQGLLDNKKESLHYY
jgi:hypothetical protein